MNKVPFLNFQINLDTFNKTLQSTLISNEDIIETLLCIEKKQYDNFIKPFEMLDEYLSQLFTPLAHINAVKNSELTQKVYADALPIITKYSTKISQNIDIYKAFKQIKTEEYTQLNSEQQRIIDLNILNFELSGAHLDTKTKERLEVINLRKSTLTNDFSQNLLDATNAYEKIIEKEDDVKGIPQSDLDVARFEVDGKTKYRFTLQMPSYIAYMTYGSNRNIREDLYKAYTTRAPQNEAIIDELMQLRQEMAKLLGFENYSQYSIASKMAEKNSDVINFLERLSTAALHQAHQELQELQESTNIKKLESFDTSYYSEILKKNSYDIDQELFRPYFEQHSVVNGLFNFLHKLFNIEFKKAQTSLWDTKASAYDLHVNSKLIARLYFDLEARKGKRGGAWMHNWQSHCQDEYGNEIKASAFVVCNFPASSKTSPSLLRHDDVVTLFHEMGHALHHMMSEVNENGVSGVNGVEWDAVEFPSQFLENFAYEPKVLQMFAKHHKTKEILSDEMIEKLVRAKNFQSALSMLRQLEFSLFDFKLHMKQHSGDEIQDLLDSIRDKNALIKPPEYNKFQNGFAHIFAGGYAAGYYSYKWAEVLSADAFFSIVDEGVFGSKTAQDYYDIILKNGGAKSMKVLFESFLHRDPDVNNLLRLNGINA
ncbi:MAG: M3 family metallopeptidase [Campylobacterota bacterium]|nr:M3 family metallopeptidase [Campylobacterota bacterium]